MQKITPHLNNQQILELLGTRLRAARLNQNLTQQQLAERAGVSESMVRLAEQGKKSLGLLNLIALLRAMNLLEQLEAFLPEPAPRPEAFVREAPAGELRLGRHKKRQRARPSKPLKTNQPWQWEE